MHYFADRRNVGKVRTPATVSALFATILADLMPLACGGCPEPYIEVQVVRASDLADALADGDLGDEDCRVLCRDSFDQPYTTGEVPATGSSTSNGGSTDDSGTTTVAPDELPPAPNHGGERLIGCAPIDGEAEQVSCEWKAICIGGRRPAGLLSEGRGRGTTAAARWFAEMAHLEAASVSAFWRLAADLREHEAPAELIARAERAADDECNHAAAIGRLAGVLGGEVAVPTLAPASRRGLYALALENAVEGCVGETWAALVAGFQAHAAADPEVREALAVIAVDEAAHAELAWAVDAWLRPRLGPTERAMVDATRARAAAAIRRAAAPDPFLAWVAGLPSPAAAEVMWSALDATLWSTAA